MPTTRHQAAILNGEPKPQESAKRSSTTRMPRKTSRPKIGKRKQDKKPKEEVDEIKSDQPPSKKAKIQDRQHAYKSGTIEHGHIFFFYRPRVEVEDVNSIDDIKNFHMLLIPRPPEFAFAPRSSQKYDGEANLVDEEVDEMNLFQTGAEAVPATDDAASTKKHYRLITVGKKRLPDPESSASGGGHRKETFWATVTAVGDDLGELAQGFEAKTYETKTRGVRHEGPVRLVARGGYAIVNSEAKQLSQRETHLGYHVSHPPPSELGEVQQSLGIYSASSFVVQVKNPLAPANTPQQAHSRPADYPDWIMRDLFGKSQGHGRAQSMGRESYGLRFANCETQELLDYKGAELLLIAAREGEAGLEISLGEGRGKVLKEKEEVEAQDSMKKVFAEIGLDFEKFPVESLQGSWV